MAITANTDISQLSPEDVIRTFAPASTTQGVSKALDIAATMRQQPSSIQVNVPDRVKSTDLTENVTTQDVMNERARLENASNFQSEFEAYLSNQGTQESGVLSRLLFPQTDTNLAKAREEQRSMLGKAGDFLSGLLGQDSVEKRDKLAAEQGLGAAQEQLAQSNIRLAQLQGELKRVRPQIETEAGQTRVGAEARLNPIERNLQAEIASEALVQAALVGNVNMIQNNIDAIMELTFADQDRDLKIFENQINLYEQQVKSLEGEAAERAQQQINAANVMLEDRRNMLESKRDEKKELADLAVAYIESTGDGAGAQKILNAQSLGEGMRIAGPYLKSETSGETPFVITSGGAKIPATEIQDYAFALQNSIGEDGYANTKLYEESLGDWLEASALLEDFFEQFPPDQYLNPEDPTISPQIRARLRKTEDSANPFA